MAESGGTTITSGTAAGQAVQGGATGTTAQDNNPDPGPDYLKQAQDASAQMDAAQAQIDALNQPIADAQKALLEAQAQGDDIAASAASKALDSLTKRQQSLTQTIQTYGQIRDEAIANHQSSIGKPLTAKEAALLDEQQNELKTRSASNDAETRLRDAQTAEQNAKNALAADPTNKALIAAATQSEIDLRNAQATAYQTQKDHDAAQLVLDQNKDAREAVLQPYKIAESVANTANTVANTANTEAGTTRINTLLPGEVDTQTANIASILENAGLDHQNALLIAARIAAGEPAANVAASNAQTNASNAAAAVSKETLRQQTQGDIATRIEQIGALLAAGKLTPTEANRQAANVLTGTTELERRQAVDKNILDATSSAMNNGMLVAPGTTTFDPGGALAAAMQQVGIKPPDFSVRPTAMPDYLKGLGVSTDANAGMPTTFNADGSLAGGVGGSLQTAAQGSGGVSAAGMSADQFQALLHGLESQPPAAQPNQASPNQQPAVHITVGGAQPAPATQVQALADPNMPGAAQVPQPVPPGMAMGGQVIVPGWLHETIRHAAMHRAA